MTIKFGYHTWSYSGFGAWVPSYTLDETIKRLGKIGFDGIEIGAAAPHAYPPDLSSARRREIRGLLDDHGLELAGIGAAPGGGPGYNPASPSPAERRATAEHYKELSGLCAEWGGRTVLYVPGWTVFGTRRRQARAWSLECLTEIAVDAAQYDVTVVIEPLAQHSNLIDDGEDAMELMEDAGLPNVKVMFDCNHVSHRQEVFGDYVHLMGRQLHQVHISDSTATEVRLPAGKGDGDWEGLVDALIETGFDGYLTAETGFLRRGISPDQDARDGLRFLKILVERKLAEQVSPPS
ncbi:sugar phosphate isomerase/epimerase family protein [Amycolatopsis japonica]|uniref:sugar phosphate isomerase/epimerase family protein n=1 Tax=Amycolatopsis japonica TaxID=208439 RepID=UPI00366DC3A1